MAYKVCLDAGHYGNYYNQSPVLKSYYESNMTWKLHNYLADELKTWGISVVKTRTAKSKDLELVSRGYKAKGCDLFISVHSNAASNSTARHAVVITMRPNDNKEYDDKSLAFAKIIAPVIADVMDTTYTIYNRPYVGDRDGNGSWDDEWYGVLQGAKLAGVPGVILEHGFHTNLAQAKWLSNDDNLKVMAAAEAQAIAKYFGIKSKKKTSTKKTVNATGYATDYDVKLSGKYKVVSSDGVLNMRDKANVNSKILVAIPSGKTVQCYGFYSVFGGAKWLFVEYKDGNTTYTGFCHSTYLKK